MIACHAAPAAHDEVVPVPLATTRPSADSSALVTDASVVEAAAATIDASPIDASPIDATRADAVQTDPPGMHGSNVPCKTDDDCWADGIRAIPRPKALRGKKFRPCVDGEHQPLCSPGRGTCMTMSFGC